MWFSKLLIVYSNTTTSIHKMQEKMLKKNRLTYNHIFDKIVSVAFCLEYPWDMKSHSQEAANWEINSIKC